MFYRRPPEHALAQPVEKALGATVALADIVRNGGVVHATHLALDGTTVNVRMSVSEFDDGYAVLCCEESEDQRSNRNLRTVVDALQEGVVLIGQNRRPFSINPAARDILGLDGRGVDDLALLAELAFYDVDGEPLSPDQHPVEATFRTGLPTLGRLIGIDRADGSRAWLMASFQLFHPERPATSPQLVSFIDFTAQRATTERLAYRAAHDVLTDLPNRAHLMETVGTLLRNGTPLCAVLFIDLDDLKTVNDTLGHDIGDVVIRTSAQRLRDVVRKRDIVGRFSGDEFVVLLVGSFEDEDVDAMVTRIRHALTPATRGQRCDTDPRCEHRRRADRAGRHPRPVGAVAGRRRCDVRRQGPGPATGERHPARAGRPGAEFGPSRPDPIALAAQSRGG
ncbi:MAG: sensor domain-containing diguanylate cyclase [Gemmatimonadales bacterium]